MIRLSIKPETKKRNNSNMSLKLTEVERMRIEKNRQKAYAIRQSKISGATAEYVSFIIKTNLS